jgi:hypothetical protein
MISPAAGTQVSGLLRFRENLNFQLDGWNVAYASSAPLLLQSNNSRILSIALLCDSNQWLQL